MSNISSTEEIKTHVLVSALSDHHARVAVVKISMNYNNNKNTTIVSRLYSNQNIESIVNLFKDESWTDFLNDVTSLDENYHTFSQILTKHTQSSFPSYTQSNNNNSEANRIRCTEETAQIRHDVMTFYKLSKNCNPREKT